MSASSDCRTPNHKVQLAIPELFAGTRRACHDDSLPCDERVPVHALGRRTALLHRQHDHPQPRLAKEGCWWCAEHQPCRTPRASVLPMETARGSPPGAAASRCWCKSLTACSAATSLCRTGSVSILPGTDGQRVDGRRWSERAYAQRGSGQDCRHTLAQEHARARRAAINAPYAGRMLRRNHVNNTEHRLGSSRGCAAIAWTPPA